ncbi:effector-binding domain-containing protein [Methanobrevibacter gottschalkii]|uniref:Effector-binding domain-containing protein n=2 Tax=Methanobrevibacter gottschalkii TaxID=190974 RepID=A0A3N5C3A5_9EURY|nr:MULTISPECIES: GyrI-like domain-containing protein [Methanobrevibacter]OEC95027.1 transcriptional regulator [Methanobrevibacter sp. A27]RPF52555.1 effector-binding domain-containing protein [Methanobrevibacter gottschalkii DSM 11977]SEK34635.1 effector-binding domain-containing protein [Methanobrevibacter gottschalkii]
MESEVKVIPEQKLAVINCKTPITDLEIFLSMLMGWVDAEEIETAGEPFIVYFSPRHQVNKGDAVFDVSIPIKEDANETDRIRVVDMISNKVLSGIHYGSADSIMETYEKLVDIAQENHYDIIGSPKEVLIKNVHNCDDEKEYITEIQLPIIEM